MSHRSAACPADSAASRRQRTDRTRLPQTSGVRGARRAPVPTSQSGSYTLQACHESLGVVKKDVAVSNGATAITVEMVRK